MIIVIVKRYLHAFVKTLLYTQKYIKKFLYIPLKF